MRFNSSTCLAFVAALLVAPAVASAGPKRGQPRPVVVMEDLDVIGQRHRPEAFYILQRSALSPVTPAPKRSFLPEIVKSVERAPF